MPPKIAVITGPTATGKTRLGVLLARRLGGEVVSADSMQLYRGMDIGTSCCWDVPFTPKDIMRRQSLFGKACPVLIIVLHEIWLSLTIHTWIVKMKCYPY